MTYRAKAQLKPRPPSELLGVRLVQTPTTGQLAVAERDCGLDHGVPVIRAGVACPACKSAI